MISSCNQIETSAPSVVFEESTTASIESINEKDLIRLSAIFASNLTDKEVLNEFYGYSQLEGNEGELEFSLKRVFESNNNQVSRKKSSIVSVFKQQSENFRIQSGGYDTEYFIDFIKANDMEVLAPYLARNFKLEEIDELTISWWTKEMEDEGLKKDPNWKGETPAFKIKLNENLSFDQILEGLKKESLEIFMVSDDYAMKNPTIVFGAFDEGLYDRSFEKSRINKENLSFVNVIPSDAGIPCAQVLPNDVVRYFMPQFRILNNTRGWPSGNYVTMWVAYGAYNLATGGIPALGFSVNKLVTMKKVNRGDFDWKSNFLNQPILTHWHESNVSIQLIFAYERKRHTLSQTVTSISSNPTSGLSVTSTTTISQVDAMLYGSQHWFRCPEINGAHKLDVGNGSFGGNAIWQMNGRDGRIQYTLEPRLSRL